IDDIDGSKADVTIKYSFEGSNYEIDLTDDHAEDFREHMQEWLDRSRRVGLARNTARTGGANSETAKIREWAREQGIDVPTRGRLAEEVDQAHEDRDDPGVTEDELEEVLSVPIDIHKPFTDLRHMHDDLAKFMVTAPPSQLSSFSASEAQLHDLQLRCNSMAYDFDVKEACTSTARWTTLIRQYIDTYALES